MPSAGASPISAATRARSASASSRAGPSTVSGPRTAAVRRRCRKPSRITTWTSARIESSPSQPGRV
ncbi:MAG: hypothetical protein ACK559_39785, partial [bacterium]